MRLAATCNFGLSSVLKSEIQKLGYEIFESTDRFIRFNGDFRAVARTNLRLRTANRIYIEVSEGEAKDFDGLFEIAKKGEWKRILPTGCPVTIRAVSEKSMLDSLPSIQKTVKKAVVEGYAGRTGEIMPEDPELPEISVLALLRNDKALILLDTSGDPLHKRGYRVAGVEAPIKETLAAGLVLLSNWRYSEPFRDPFCGSGTIAIEAAMIAKNIAPGILRSFAFERFPFADEIPFEEERQECLKREMRDKPHDIVGSDVDMEAIDSARKNAAAIGLDRSVKFEVAEFPNAGTLRTGTLVTNPPYGERLADKRVATSAHEALFDAFRSAPTLSGGIITAFEEAAHFSGGLGMKDRKIPNGPIPCRYYFRTPNRG
ncbi:MAG: putative N6-adenine-specific methylase [Patescibacteria group bacterium]|nr:putative N6-adenine-specific methylase [Patescibacteria group bacterium]